MKRTNRKLIWLDAQPVCAPIQMCFSAIVADHVPQPLLENAP
jgi:hypothetical protein